MRNRSRKPLNIRIKEQQPSWTIDVTTYTRYRRISSGQAHTRMSRVHLTLKVMCGKLIFKHLDLLRSASCRVSRISMMMSKMDSLALALIKLQMIGPRRMRESVFWSRMGRKECINISKERLPCSNLPQVEIPQQTPQLTISRCQWVSNHCLSLDWIVS